MSVSEAPCLAAVDLGSNSFHMVIARVQGDVPVTLDRLREQVQLAAGLNSRSKQGRRISPEAWERSMACLERFGQRLRNMAHVRVRAVGTNTLRVASNGAEFRAEAEEALGYPIEVISGNEEARLIYLGVAHTVSDDSASRLVVDIGGGSTECIVGQRFEARATHSFYMGCVQFTSRFFADGKITNRRMSDAVLTAQQELYACVQEYREAGWTEAVGASGTIRAVAAVAAANGWCEEGVSYKAVKRLRKELVAAGNAEAVATLPGMKASRANIIAGGTAILQACFESLEIETMSVAKGALREGVLYDLLGRLQHEDVRERTIVTFQERYHVDRGQAERVERTASKLLQIVAKDWEVDEEKASPFLLWAARLHEIGLTVSYNRHHRHGAYLIENADMPGFSRDDQQLLALLVSAHRRRVRADRFEQLRHKGRRMLAAQLVLILRAAVLLNRGRSAEALPPLAGHAQLGTLTITLPRSWLDAHPLADADLAGETAALQELDMSLQVIGV